MKTNSGKPGFENYWPLYETPGLAHNYPNLIGFEALTLDSQADILIKNYHKHFESIIICLDFLAEGEHCAALKAVGSLFKL